MVSALHMMTAVSAEIYMKQKCLSVCLFVCLSVTFGGGGGCQGRRGGGQEGGNGEGDFYDRIPGWTYFSLATLGH